jgi:hypothetical protein
VRFRTNAVRRRATHWRPLPLCCWCLSGRPTPTTRQLSSGDRHLNFYGTRDNLT